MGDYALSGMGRVELAACSARRDALHRTRCPRAYPAPRVLPPAPPAPARVCGCLGPRAPAPPEVLLAPLDALPSAWRAARRGLRAPGGAWVQNGLERQSTCALELDAAVGDLVRLCPESVPLTASDRSTKMVQSLLYIWDDLRARSGGVDLDQPLSATRSQPPEPLSMSERFAHNYDEVAEQEAAEGEGEGGGGYALPSSTAVPELAHLSPLSDTWPLTDDASDPADAPIAALLGAAPPEPSVDLGRLTQWSQHASQRASQQERASQAAAAVGPAGEGAAGSQAELTAGDLELLELLEGLEAQEAREAEGGGQVGAGAESEDDADGEAPVWRRRTAEEEASLTQRRHREMEQEVEAIHEAAATQAMHEQWEEEEAARQPPARVEPCDAAEVGQPGRGARSGVDDAMEEEVGARSGVDDAMEEELGGAVASGGRAREDSADGRTAEARDAGAEAMRFNGAECVGDSAEEGEGGECVAESAEECIEDSAESVDQDSSSVDGEFDNGSYSNGSKDPPGSLPVYSQIGQLDGADPGEHRRAALPQLDGAEDSEPGEGVGAGSGAGRGGGKKRGREADRSRWLMEKGIALRSSGRAGAGAGAGAGRADGPKRRRGAGHHLGPSALQVIEVTHGAGLESPAGGVAADLSASKLFADGSYGPADASAAERAAGGAEVRRARKPGGAGGGSVPLSGGARGVARDAGAADDAAMKPDLAAEGGAPMHSQDAASSSDGRFTMPATPSADRGGGSQGSQGAASARGPQVLVPETPDVAREKARWASRGGASAESSSGPGFSQAPAPYRPAPLSCRHPRRQSPSRVAFAERRLGAAGCPPLAPLSRLPRRRTGCGLCPAAVAAVTAGRRRCRLHPVGAGALSALRIPGCAYAAHTRAGSLGSRPPEERRPVGAWRRAGGGGSAAGRRRARGQRRTRRGLRGGARRGGARLSCRVGRRRGQSARRGCGGRETDACAAPRGLGERGGGDATARGGELAGGGQGAGVAVAGAAARARRGRGGRGARGGVPRGVLLGAARPPCAQHAPFRGQDVRLRVQRNALSRGLSAAAPRGSRPRSRR